MNRLEAGRDYPISIIVADLDGLKKINDSMGHAMGDELLKTCAEILCRSLRQSDILARVGGDEFTVLLPNTDIAVSREITERIRARIKEHNESDPRLSLSLSIGVATAERKDGSLENTYSTADNRMYQDKISRRQSKE